MGKMWINLFNILIRACTCRPPGKHYFQSFSFCKTDIGNAKKPSCILILNIQKILFKVGGLIICRPVPGRQNINRTWPLSVPLFPGPKTSTRIEFTYGTPLLNSPTHRPFVTLWYWSKYLCAPTAPWDKNEKNMVKTTREPLEDRCQSPCLVFLTSNSATNIWPPNEEEGSNPRSKVCSEQTKLDITNGFCGTIKAGWHKDFLQ